MPVLWVLMFSFLFQSCSSLSDTRGPTIESPGYSGSRQLDERSLREGFYRR